MPGDRTTKVTLRADTANYISNMEKAAATTRKMADDSQAKLAQHTQSLQAVGTAAFAMGTVLAAGVALAVSKFAEFDKAMSGVQAATHESSSNMGLLREAAIKAGADTVFSATEAANAVEELSKAGLSTADVLSGALAGSLDLASAGELGVAKAAGIMSTALTQFHQPGSAASHVADLLAAGAGKAMGSVEDLSGALNQGGLVASQAGMSIEETTGTLAAFASAGLLGSDAGTSLKTMLLALEKPSKQAQDTMDQYGISVYDANGNMLSMSSMAGQLQDKLGTLSAAQRNSALATIFGTDAVRSASVLYDQGADGIQDWIDKTNDAGYAAETARLKLDNLSGDLEQLGGSIDTVLIQTGSGANEVLRALTQDLTGFINSIGQVPAPVLGIGLGLAALMSAASLAGGAFFLAVPKLAAFRVALETMGPVAQRTGAALGAVGKAAGIVAVVAAAVEGLSLLAHTMDAASASAEDLQNALKVGGTGAKTFATTFKGLDAFHLNAYKDDWGGFIDVISRSPDNRWLPGFTHDLFALAPAMDKGRDSLAALGKEMSSLDPGQASATFRNLVKEMGGSKKAASELLDLMPDYRDALIAQATALDIDVTSGSKSEIQTKLLKLAQDGATGSTEDNSAALEALSGKATSATTDIGALSDAIKGFGSTQLDANAAERDFQAAIDDQVTTLQAQKDAYLEAHKTMAGFTNSLDIGTDAGRENSASLDAIAQKAIDMAAAVSQQTNGQEKATKAISDGRDALIAALAQFGITGKAADDYADSLGLIPKDVATAVTISTDPAQAALDAWLKANANHKVHIATSFSGGQVDHAAGGGTVTGVGTSKSDSNLYALSVGEEVIQEPYATRYRPILKQINMGMFPGYADGGTVGFQPAPVYTPAPPRMYMPGPGPSQGVSVSLDGARIVLDVGGQEIIGVIRGQAASVLNASTNRAYAASLGRS